MKPIMIIEAHRPGLDCVIVWEQDDQIVAFAYENGRVTMTRRITAPSMAEAVNEVKAGFQINEGQLTRVHDWTEQTVTSERIVQMPSRWR